MIPIPGIDIKRMMGSSSTPSSRTLVPVENFKKLARRITPEFSNSMGLMIDHKIRSILELKGFKISNSFFWIPNGISISGTLKKT
jgi:hypothetical protein